MIENGKKQKINCAKQQPKGKVVALSSVIKPSVEDNGENVKVPLMYASPERWKSIQQDGFMRDKKDQIITPVIVYKRTSVEKDDSLPQDKLDANNPNLFYTFEKKFSQENIFIFDLEVMIFYQKDMIVNF